MTQNLTIVVNAFVHPNPERAAAITDAIQWLADKQTQYPKLRVISFNYADDVIPDIRGITVFRALKRDAKTLYGVERRTPFLLDLLDGGYDSGADVFGYVNADILVPAATITALTNLVPDAAILARTDIAPCTIAEFEQNKMTTLNAEHPGFDGIFFKRKWWQKNRQVLPENLIVGECAWDDAYSWLLWRIIPDHLRLRGLYHVKHEQAWHQETRGGQHNIAIFKTIQSRCAAGDFHP